MTQQKNTDELIGKVINPKELVSYQTGAVVSRTVIDKKTGTCTLFAFDAGQGLSEHTAPFDALVYLLDGEAEITISGTPFHLKNGDAIIMPADKPHALKAVKQFKMMLVMIKN
ncbi:MAG: cupin [Chloroflexi bacterium RBG_16_51_9]|nr:MAG: cupin [Chloroflexi bacterium RBG_16_51_9]HLB28084.1 cupin domain-containing protein [Dehalococcoidales bacterium]